jgi:hypothetical protein
MEINHSDYNTFASVYIRGDKETISKILLYATQLNAEALTPQPETKTEKKS